MSLLSKKWVYIYLLLDPDTDNPVYVGKSIDPVRRYAGHLNCVNTYNKAWRDYITSLRKQLKMPVLQVIAYTDNKEAEAVEKDLISTYGILFPLYNQALYPRRKKVPNRGHRGRIGAAMIQHKKDVQSRKLEITETLETLI